MPLPLDWNCHSWLYCWLPQDHCCTTVPFVVPIPAASTQALLFWLTTLNQELVLMLAPLTLPLRPRSVFCANALVVVHCSQSAAIVAEESVETLGVVAQCVGP